MARLQGTLQTSHRCNIIDIEYLRLHDLLSSNERMLKWNIVLDYRQLFHLDRVLVDRFVEQVRYGGADHDRKQDRKEHIDFLRCFEHDYSYAIRHPRVAGENCCRTYNHKCVIDVVHWERPHRDVLVKLAERATQNNGG